MHNIYLDNAATTKPLAELEQLYTKYTNSLWQNPSALYAPAVAVQKQLKQAAETLLHAFGSPIHKCFFTSSGTEAANTVLLRGARNKKNMNYVVGGAEHPCVAESCHQLAESGAEVRYAKPDSHGYISPEAVSALVDENTALVSIIHVSNETGAKNDIAAIAAAVKNKNPQALFHSDGVQAFLHETSVDTSNIDYYTASAHKLHAHKGTGVVFYKPGSPLKPLLPGGGQEGGLRSGTENTLGILCFAYVAQYFMDRQAQHVSHIQQLKEALLCELNGINGIHLLSPHASMACNHIVNLSFEGVAGETLLHTLEASGIYIATGSACSSKKGRSRIATALGLPKEIANGSIRVSFSVFNTVEEVQIAAEEIKKNAALLQRYKRV